MSVTSKELAGLYRTFHPKYSQYKPDGDGRDAYIIQNNGGMRKENRKNIFESACYYNEKPRMVIPAPHKEATSFKYVSDGNGRDFYITHNSGGLQAPYLPGSLKAEAQFIASLRHIEKRNKSSRFPSPQERMRMKKSLMNQKMLIKRLTSNNKEWKNINKEYRASVIKSMPKKMSLPGYSMCDYGPLMSTLNNT